MEPRVLSNREAGGGYGPRKCRPVFAILDTGPGIPEEPRTHLFPPIFSTKRNGRGFGLTPAHEILAQHGFGLSLENHERGGVGLTIRF